MDKERPGFTNHAAESEFFAAVLRDFVAVEHAPSETEMRALFLKNCSNSARSGRPLAERRST